MRVYLIYLVVLGLAVYALRDWFLSLVVLLVMQSLMKHGDMPHSLFGITGLNLWNTLWAAVVLGWIRWRCSEPRPRMPTMIVVAFLLYFLVILITGLRGAIDVDAVRRTSEDVNEKFAFGSFSSEFIGNPVKFLVVAMLLADGFVTQRNALLGIGSVCLHGVIYAVMVVKHIPFAILSSALSRYRFRIGEECGLQANDMALVLVITFWVLACSLSLTRGRTILWKTGIIGMMGVVGLAFSYCQSRGGYLAVLVVGILFAVARMRVLLIVLPVAALLICFIVPTIPERLMQGVEETDVAGGQSNDLDTISAGRMTNLWPPVLDAIGSSPLVGYGRLAIWRTSLYDAVLAREGSVPSHPHNAYLEVLLDAGAVGLCCILSFLVGVPLAVLRSKQNGNSLLLVARDCGVASAISLLVMGLTGQSFFPREGVFLALCGYGLMVGSLTANQTARRAQATALNPPVRIRAQVHGRNRGRERCFPPTDDGGLRLSHTSTKVES